MLLFTLLSCIHPEVCTIASLAHREQKDVEVQEIRLETSNDPHAHEVSSTALKKTLQADQLITPPKSYAPWVNKLVEERKKLNKHTTVLEISSPSLSHFWLFPEVQCELIHQLNSKATCPNMHAQLLSDWEEVAKKAKAKKVQFVLSHNALVPHFQKYHLDFFQISNNAESDHHHGHDHFHEISAMKIKEIYQLCKQTTPIIWVVEKDFKRYCPNMHIVDVATEGLEQNEIHPLQQLIDGVKKYVD